MQSIGTGKKIVNYCVINKWNSLPNHVVTAHSINCFWARLDKTMFWYPFYFCMFLILSFYSVCSNLIYPFPSHSFCYYYSYIYTEFFPVFGAESVFTHRYRISINTPDFFFGVHMIQTCFILQCWWNWCFLRNITQNYPCNSRSIYVNSRKKSQKKYTQILPAVWFYE